MFDFFVQEKNISKLEFSAPQQANPDTLQLKAIGSSQEVSPPFLIDATMTTFLALLPSYYKSSYPLISSLNWGEHTHARVALINRNTSFLYVTRSFQRVNKPTGLRHWLVGPESARQSHKSIGFKKEIWL